MRPRLLRSRIWTGALAAVLGGFALLGLAGLAVRSSPVEVVISLALTAGALLGLGRALQMGVQLTPSGLAVRELTRTTLIPWARIRAVTCEKTDRRGISVPVLLLAPPAGGGRSTAGGRSTGGQERLELTVLGSYKAEVAQQRTDEIAKARPAAPRRRR